MPDLELLGWNESIEAAFAAVAGDGLVPGRVAAEHRAGYTVLTRSGEFLAGVKGKARFAGAGLPATGDWVVLRALPGEDRALICAILPRATKLSRKSAGRETIEQVLAANVDVVFCVDGCDVRARRLERYMAAAWDSGAEPVVVLTKADLCDDPAEAASEAETVAMGVPVHVTSAVTGEGVEELRGYLDGNRTAVLVGPSGVGKSTLINRLSGRELLPTAEIRGDGRARHTTTRRELVLIPGGGVLLDTPGLRELALWGNDGLTVAFEDVQSVGAGCRFRDCAHEHEPGCAVRDAIEEGSLQADRLRSYRKLQRELDYLERRQDRRAAMDTKRRWKAITKANRQRTRFNRN